jgi:hypothetical protein
MSTFFLPKLTEAIGTQADDGKEDGKFHNFKLNIMRGPYFGEREVRQFSQKVSELTTIYQKPLFTALSFVYALLVFPLLALPARYPKK